MRDVMAPRRSDSDWQRDSAVEKRRRGTRRDGRGSHLQDSIGDAVIDELLAPVLLVLAVPVLIVSAIQWVRSRADR